MWEKHQEKVKQEITSIVTVFHLWQPWFLFPFQPSGYIKGPKRCSVTSTVAEAAAVEEKIGTAQLISDYPLNET